MAAMLILSLLLAAAFIVHSSRKAHLARRSELRARANGGKDLERLSGESVASAANLDVEASRQVESSGRPRCPQRTTTRHAPLARRLPRPAARGRGGSGG